MFSLTHVLAYLALHFNTQIILHNGCYLRYLTNRKKIMDDGLLIALTK
jgi:hypothetical protein